jgi:RNA polymerase sigma-70 factor (ECF subfamily)
VGRQETIRATFAQLPEIDRTTLALREVCSMSYEEMAEVLQVPLGTVRSRLAKARQRFIEKFKGVQHD